MKNTPNEAAVIAAILKEANDLLQSKMSQIRKDAAEVFQMKEDAEKPVAKITISATWPTEDESPELEISLGWSVAKKFTTSHVVDPNQTTFPEIEK